MKKVKTYTAIAAILICIVYSLLNPKEITYYVSSSLKMCAYSVIPSLFMFICITKITAGFLSNTQFSSHIQDKASRALGISSSLLPVCILGLVSGAPSGAYGVCDIYKKGLCTKHEAQRACVLCNNCSASFILSVASSLFADKTTSILLLFANILSTISVYFIFFRQPPQHNIKYTSAPKQSFCEIITKSISGTMSDCLSLCSYVTFFYTLCSVIISKLTFVLCRFTDDTRLIGIFRSVMLSLFELSSGVMSAAGVTGYLRIVICAFSISFLGISIFFQVSSVLKQYGLSAREFIVSKLICSLVCPLYILLLLFIVPVGMPVSNIDGGNKLMGFSLYDGAFLLFSTALWFVCGIILSKQRKITKKQQ